MKPPPDPDFSPKIWRWRVGVFLGAWLTFSIQPLMGKHLLPMFGGGPGVWSVSLLFFQSTLFLGYLLAHLFAQHLSTRYQSIACALFAACGWLLVSLPPGAFGNLSNGQTSLGVLWTLSQSVGMFLIALGMTTPLLQHWFAAAFPKRSAYPLMAFSSAGSLLALFGYPFLFEPFISRTSQGVLWWAGGLFWVLLIAWIGRQSSALERSRGAERSTDEAQFQPDQGSNVENGQPLSSRKQNLQEQNLQEQKTSERWSPESDVFESLRSLHFPKAKNKHSKSAHSSMGWWIALSAVGSSLLVSTTQRLTQDIASAPLLWTIPLGVYLLTFILSFSERWRYSPSAGGVAIFSAWGLAFFMDSVGQGASLVWQLIGHSSILFGVAWFAHSELHRLRPPQTLVTSFNLAIAFGGALGSAFTSLAAPLLFERYWEHLAALALCGVFFVALRYREEGGRRLARIFGALCLALLPLFVVGGVVGESSGYGGRVVKRARSFYGVLKVVDREMPSPRRVLLKGGVVHGMQLLGRGSKTPTSYYTLKSGVGVALAALRKRQPVLRIGVVGLGAGVIATYGQLGDSIVFFEIDPGVIAVAQEEFTFLSDSPAEIKIIEGDARVCLEQSSPLGLDLLVLDAFSSGGVPLHLLTLEALEVYRRHLNSGGILAAHLSSKHLRLAALMRATAMQQGLGALLLQREAEESWELPSRWILIGDLRRLRSLKLSEVATPWGDDDLVIPWSDELNSPLNIWKGF